VPLIEPQFEVPAERPESQAVEERLDCRVLIVDDQVDVRHLVQRSIRDVGGETIVAANGLQALEAVEHANRSGRPVDVILMDMQMPFMDGYQATTQLRSNGFSRPIIALTAHAMVGARQKCLDAGCNDYVCKPIDRRRLIGLIRRHVERDAHRLAMGPHGTEATRNSDSLQESAHRKTRVLFVDDAPLVCRMMWMLLEGRGYDVRCAENGSDAIDAARDFCPDVVVLDLGLPDISGYEVAARIREIPALESCVLIALSGSSGEDTTQRALEVGFHHHVVKPADIDELEKLFSAHPAEQHSSN
jgi:two-component system CheB/CheR fusion protein